MRQVQIDRFGTADELHVTEVPVPVPGPGQVLVRVQAAATNPVDYKMRDGSSGAVKNLTDADFPLVLGREAAGIVDALGEGVTRLAVGDLVFGMLPFAPGVPGCYAEYVVFPESSLSAAPAGTDVTALAGLALAGSTAWVAVHEQARVGAGEKVLVHGGAGGVGQLMVQLCRDAGAEVWATASTRNQDRLRELGATPIDYTTTDFRQASPKLDVVLDAVYFDTFVPSLDHLVEGGRIVVLPTLADIGPAVDRGIEVHIPSIHPLPDELAELARRLAAGTLSLEVSRVLPLERAADAHRELESGHARGKIVLDPNPLLGTAD
ncbi:NADP-dependent oxidoreductase [Tessaracoccus sp. SD287]|uniref:NADP-dependent oxidoreductase n=1 Tax=Tessaracoccus sp. SD287 TaxID=2782008 RepID=UPI001A960DC8|nr:NADP-dependent oxidoreductase [Tessaracoccus sp. SD287]MBO1031893.1 NADP-dependent oxidoreductase [Tessaracoccus sp. SD287]